jgi:ornithine lipid ester-linked acyl 2-hydroxylase
MISSKEAAPAPGTTPPATRSSSSTEPWYNLFGGRYDRGQPFFYNRDALPWTRTLEDNAAVIQREMLALLEDSADSLKPYFINKAMSFPPRHWKTVGLLFWNLRMHKNCRRCPKTARILESIPNLTAGSLSVLEPGSNINPHQGDTDAIIRCHLGLSIPASLPECGFQVGPEIRSWEEGKALPFCDAHTHWAWNRTRERRMVLIVDVIRPEYARKKNAVCSHVLASSMLQILYQKFRWLDKAPGRIKWVLYSMSRIAIQGFLPVQRRLPFVC